MPITKEEIGDRMLDGKIIKLSDDEKQAIADEQNEAQAAIVVRDAKRVREGLILDRMDKIVRNQAVTELIRDGVIT